MKRRLILMRHAKSSWKQPGLSDHQRPLNKRGRNSAPLVGREISKLGWTPDWVVSSDAKRTCETFELMSEIFGEATDVAYFNSLYLGDLFDIQEVLSQMADDVSTTLALGHNPGWSSAVSWFSGESLMMTTANAALLEGEGDSWSQAIRSQNSWRLVDVICPREIE